MPYRSPARWLGPLALLGAAVAVYAVIASAGGSADDAPEAVAPARTATTKSAQRSRGERARTYTVKRGDVLSAIAERTGVSVERLQRLNPDIDAQSLRVGQRLKLVP